MKTAMNMQLIEIGAHFSECRKYRYALWRIWDHSKPLLMFVGLNPSTANEHGDDPTIRKVKAFANRLGYGGVYMMNCFPFVSTNPEKLRDVGNTSENDEWLQKVGLICSDVIFAWGAFAVVRDTNRDRQLTDMFPGAKALVINKDGSPRHPLYVPYSVSPVLWKKGVVI